MTNMLSLELNDFLRLIDIIRIDHHQHSSPQQISLDLYQKIEILMNEAFKDNTKFQLVYNISTRSYLISTFTELLIIEGEIDKACDFLQTKVSDAGFMKSPLLLTTHFIATCLKVILTINSISVTDSSSNNNNTKKKSTLTSSIDIITLPAIINDLLQFSSIIKNILLFKSSTSSRSSSYNTNTNSASSSTAIESTYRYLQELKTTSSSALRHDQLENITFSSLYLGYLMGLNMKHEVSQF